MQRQSLNSDRNYQQEVVCLPAAMGASSTAWAPDAYSRTVLPALSYDVVDAWINILHKSDASSWNLEIGAVATGRSFTQPGRYNITELFRAVVDASNRTIYARLTGGTGAYQILLEIYVKKPG
jgi:hypothetical protein